MDIAVCDDEAAVRGRIGAMIKRRSPDTRLFLCASGEELLACGRQFDMVFLDIRMSGMNGLDAARALREKNQDTVIVFITALREYVFDAFDVSAFHYLVKPVGEERFSEVFDRAATEARMRVGRESGKILIRAGRRNLLLEKADILFAESRGKKAELHTSGEILEIRASMRSLEKQLGTGFFRSHRGYLVNMAYIEEYDNSSILLRSRDRVWLAKEKYGEFVKAYMHYLRNGGASGV